jgi:hypothetical protein
MATKGNTTKNEVVTNLDVLSESQQAKVVEIKQAGGQAEVTKCRFCGKYLIRDKSVEQEAGDYCEHLREDLGYTTETLMAHRATMSAPTAPEGYIKVADLHKICEAAGIPVNRMVNAIGRDRGLSAPIDPRFRPVYVKGTRWVDGWCATKEGLAMIAGVRPTKDQKAQAEVKQLEEAVK